MCSERFPTWSPVNWWCNMFWLHCCDISPWNWHFVAAIPFRLEIPIRQLKAPAGWWQALRVFCFHFSEMSYRRQPLQPPYAATRSFKAFSYTVHRFQTSSPDPSAWSHHAKVSFRGLSFSVLLVAFCQLCWMFQQAVPAQLGAVNVSASQRPNTRAVINFSRPKDALAF